MQGNYSKRSRAAWARGIAAVWAVLAVAAGGGSASAAPVETVLYSFTYSDGGYPVAGLIADSSGNLYGTTRWGGASGFGAVFKLSPGGTETVLYSFKGGSDGANPAAGLIADSSGNLYGTTNSTVFKLTPGGIFTVLYSPGSVAGLIADSSGNLYCTTFDGGASAEGVVFKLSPSGTYTALYSFKGGSDGRHPSAGLIADSSGNLYGTTFDGGASGEGVVYKLSPSGTETVLYSFKGGSDGAFPAAGLIADSSGNLYGTTKFGGAPGLGCGGAGCGVVFKLTPSGTETVLHAFTGRDGSYPAAGLIADRSGNLYGTTFYGGLSARGDYAGSGVVFELSPGGTETVLYSFGGNIDGGFPQAGLFADASGNLYGTTYNNGASSHGVVFKLTGTGFVPPVPFAAFNSNLVIQFGSIPTKDAFGFGANLTLSSTAPAIHPLTDRVTLQIGTSTTAIPVGSFKKQTDGSFAFQGNILGVTVGAFIKPSGTLQYEFRTKVSGVNMTGNVNPVPVTLTIGNNSGTASVTAAIH